MRLVAPALGVTGALAAPNPDRANAVKEAFMFSWNGYMKYAYPHDDLHPVSNGYGDSRNGWGASATDALSTALVMNLPDVVDSILTHIAQVDYTTTDRSVSLFETTIRYVGGMLSGYDLLTGPLASMKLNERAKVPLLLEQTKTLADKLSFAFNTATGIPYNDLWFVNDTFAGERPLNGPATVGTLIMEWARLSDLLGDPKYANLVKNAEAYLLNPQFTDMPPWPGLVGYDINIDTGKFVNGVGSWSGGIDSFYEYLIKMYVYDPATYAQYRDRWILAVETSMQHLNSHPPTNPDVTWLAEYSGQTQELKSGHLTCFDGGNFILGGLYLDRQDIVNYGIALTNGCHATYEATATRIGPERWGWDGSSVPDTQKDFFNANGFYIIDSSYDLRPEVIESYYYAYRATGDSMYQDWAWDAFLAVNSTCRVGSGFSAIRDVNQVDGGEFMDNQESFWFAEVMKYAYLIQAEEGDWQVSFGGKDKFVWNTEAHPLKVKAVEYPTTTTTTTAAPTEAPTDALATTGEGASALWSLSLVALAASVLTHML